MLLTPLGVTPGVGVLPNISHIGMCCVKNGFTLCPFWSGIGYDFEITAGVYERIYRLNYK